MWQGEDGGCDDGHSTVNPCREFAADPAANQLHAHQPSVCRGSDGDAVSRNGRRPVRGSRCAANLLVSTSTACDRVRHGV